MYIYLQLQFGKIYSRKNTGRNWHARMPLDFICRFYIWKDIGHATLGKKSCNSETFAYWLFVGLLLGSWNLAHFIVLGFYFLPYNICLMCVYMRSSV